MNGNFDFLGVLAYMGFKVETVDGEDLTDDLRGINSPIFNGRKK